MKKVLLCVSALILITGLIVIGGPEEPAIAKTITLKLAHHLPPMHQQHRGVFVPWAKELEKRTGGRVKVKIFPSQQLGSHEAAYDIISSGTADMGLVNPSAHRGRFPLDEIFHLPFLIPGDTGDPVGSKIRNVLYDKYLMPIHFKDTKLLWTGRFGLNVIHTVKKPIRTLDDIKGMVIGIPGGRIVTKFIQMTGASPESSPVPEMYTNLERGVIDGQTIPMEAMVAFKLQEVVKYVTRVNCSGSSFLVPMNMKTWNSLPPDIQKIIEDMRPWVEDIQAKAWAGATHYAEVVAKKSGIELIDFSPEERARWVAVGKPLEALWVKEMNEKGYPASEMYQLVKDMLPQ